MFKNKKIAIVLIIIIALLLLCGAAIALYLNSTIYKDMVPTVEGENSGLGNVQAPESIITITEEEFHQGQDNVEIEAPIGTPEPIYKEVPISDRVYNVLIIGDDARRGQPRGRSDTQILCSFNRDTKEIKMVSFMRDTLIPISEEKWNRINTPYMSGGPGKAINTLNKIFQLDIQRYVIIRFDTVFALVDKIGGIDVKIDAAEAKYVNKIFPEYDQLQEGIAHMNGRQALAFARARKVGGSGDFERTRRQRDVVKAAFDKARQTRDPAQLLALVNFAIENIETNIPVDEAVSMGMEILKSDGAGFSEKRIPVDNAYRFASYKGASILTINFKKNIEAVHEFLYGSTQGLRIPNFGEPVFDSDLIETPLPSEVLTSPTPTPEPTPTPPPSKINSNEGQVSPSPSPSPASDPAASPAQSAAQ